MFPSTTILTMKIMLMSCGIISLAVAMKYTFVPLIIHFIASDFPTICSVILLMFKPPYLFLVLNGIILIITLISRFTQNQTESSSSPLIPPPGEIPVAFVEPPLEVVEKVAIPSEVWEVKMPVVVNGLDVAGNYEGVGEEDEAEVVSEAENEEAEEVLEEMPHETLPVTEKPLLLLTASAEQKHSIFRPEGRSKSTKVRVINHNRHETLDSTWRMITEGRQALPLTRHMKNNLDTFGNLENQLKSPVRQNSLFRKSATFKDRTNFLHEPQVMSSGNLRKEPSFGKEELNRRVEAFIKKFNEDIRLQRQESLHRYMDMVNRGAN